MQVESAAPSTELPPPNPRWSETDRLAALHRYRILDTEPEQAFEDLARIAAQVCGTPIALVNLVAETRQWFKAEIGFGLRETSLDVSICRHAILQPGLFVVEDLVRDPRFAGNPLVTGAPRLRFYAGAPLKTPDGLPLGTLCVLDREPRTLTPEQAFTLEALARQVMTQLELRQTIAEQWEREKAVGHFAAIVASTDDAMTSFDLEGRILTWNAGAERLFGYRPNEAIGRSYLDLVPEELQESEREAFLAGHRLDLYRFETMRRRQDGSLFHAEVTGAPIRDLGGSILGVAATVRDITERREAEERRSLLVRELHHRVKNTLTTVQAIASLTARTTFSVEAFREAFGGRIAALAKTHSLLTEERWQMVPLHDLLRLELEPYEEGGTRLTLDGPALPLPSDIAVSLSMAVHELTTNAAKHGALSVPTGHVSVTWRIVADQDPPMLNLVWKERGGPPVTAPTRTGFGSQLLQRLLSAQINAVIDHAFEPDGVRYTIEISLRA